MLQLQHISKRFGTLAALSDISLQIPPGRILGLLGENGAGKSTLMNILFGLLRPDSGSITFRNAPVRITSPRKAQSLAIGMVHQHFKLVPTLTALQNLRIFLRGSAESIRGSTNDLLTRLHWNVPLDTPVDALAVGQQQRIEILKALLAMHAATRGHTAQASAGSAADQSAGTLILDEPTAVLTPQEAVELFAALKSLRAAGTAIVFISHKLNEVTQLCDDLAILRRGKLVHTGPAGELSAEQIARHMVGARVALPHLQRLAGAATAMPRPQALALEHISTSLLKSVSLALHPGEILGIAGVDGNGQSHLAQVILGTRTPDAGKILLSGKPAPPLRRRLDHIAFIAEDRQREALVLPLSIQDNLLLKDYRTSRFSTFGWLRFRAWRSHSRELMRQFDIRAASIAATAGRLSGGNQQKVVLARELYTPPADAGAGKPIVLAVNPTRGLDVGATAFVLQKLLDARQNGAAILLIHSDLDELLAVSDRVAVLFDGHLTHVDAAEPAKETIGRLMLGLRPAPLPHPQPHADPGATGGGHP